MCKRFGEGKICMSDDHVIKALCCDSGASRSNGNIESWSFTAHHVSTH
jgi:hypothetical protein